MVSTTNKMNYLFGVMMLIGWLFAGCSTEGNKKQEKLAGTDIYYTCSMHPQIHEDKPGNCPICGMKLIKVEQNQKRDTTSLDTAWSYLAAPVTSTVVGGFKTITPALQNGQDTITADGHIGFDQRDLNTVSSRVAGRIERLYIKYSGQPVQKGQPLMEIYSPELLSAQRDLLQTIAENDQPLIHALKEKLVNLGMQESEIERLMETKAPLTVITIFSLYQGIARQISEQPENTVTELLDIRSGMYVEKGQTVFAIQKMNRRWALLNVFAEDIGNIHLDDPVELYADAQPQNRITGRIDFIPPYRENEDKTTTVRVYLDNLPDKWKIGTLIHGKIADKQKGSSLYIPLSAVNRLGTKNVVWVKDKKQDDVFHATLVQTGIRTEDSIEILSGIKAGDQIVENAAYMVDSDSFIQ